MYVYTISLQESYMLHTKYIIEELRLNCPGELGQVLI